MPAIVALTVGIIAVAIWIILAVLTAIFWREWF
jgi:hypothetical protein